MIWNRVKFSLFVLVFCANCVSAQNIYNEIQPANPVLNSAPQLTPTSSGFPYFDVKKVTLSKNEMYNQYAIGLNRFMQSNVKSAYGDFQMMIESMPQNDYGYLQMSVKMADIGFFNLAEMSLNKVKDNEISLILDEEIHRFYFPSVKLSRQDEVYLGEIFSNIIYNDQSKEATAELIKNSVLMEGSDYANYLVALGSIKSGEQEQALNYINTAISKNPDNMNYQKLKAEILSQGNKAQSSLKIVEQIKSNPFITREFSDKVSSLEQYILYKSGKIDSLKNYHLAYHYYYENELNKAMRTLQGSVSAKKKYNKDIYALLSRVYFDMKEFEKAEDMALKACKIDKNNVMALLVLGDVEYRNKNFKEALKYYEKAVSNDKKNPLLQVKTALVYKNLSDDKKSKEILAKILKTHSDCAEAYYYMALYDKDRESQYLKKSLALDLYLKDAWIDMARLEIEKKNLPLAKNYLLTAKYIDENDFRYYYYQGVIAKSEGYNSEAKMNFEKSLKLNPDFSLAKEELSI